MTIYNTSRYLREAIESVFAQRTAARWELLLVDDGSTDGSYEIACEFGRRWPEQVRVLTHGRRRNRGISASRNLALREARAPITAFLDSDDVWLEDRLESQLPILRENEQVAMVYAQAERWVDFAVPYDEDEGARGGTSCRR